METQNSKPTTNNQQPTPKIIGITGGIGSGKSTVSKYIEEMGFPVYNSDYWAKELVNFDENLKSKIINVYFQKVLPNPALSQFDLHCRRCDNEHGNNQT